MPESSDGAPARSSARTAFVTWAHDDPAWEKTIATLVFALRQLGIAADVDLFHVNDIDVNWATYGARAIEENQFVLIAVSRAFKERWEGAGNPRHGAGAAREANVLKGIFDENQQAFFKKIKVLILPGATTADIPLELRATGHRFELASFDLPGLEDLLRTLTNQSTYLPPKVGSVPILPPRFLPDGDAAASSVANLQTRLAQLDSRLSQHANDDEASDEKLDTERITVEAALETVGGRVRGRAPERSRLLSLLPRRHAARVVAGSLSASIAVAVAVWLTLASGGDATARIARTGPLKITFGRPWHVVQPPSGEDFPGLAIESPVSLAADKVSLRAGPLRNSASVPGEPPPGLTALIGRPSASTTVSLGRLPAARYVWNSPFGTLRRALFVIATDTGDLAVACQSVDATTLSGCDKIAASAQVTGAHVLRPGRQPLVAKGIEAALAPAIAVRRKHLGLASSRPDLREAAARRLEAADETASRTLARLPAPERIEAMIRDLSVALHREAGALRRFARAAGRRAVGPYRSARQAVEGARRPLDTALEGMRSADYATAFPRLHIPLLPAPTTQPAATSNALGARAPAPTPTIGASSPTTPAPITHSSPKKRAYGPTIIAEPTG